MTHPKRLTVRKSVGNWTVNLGSFPNLEVVTPWNRGTEARSGGCVIHERVEVCTHTKVI